jgi:hypothetical protein
MAVVVSVVISGPVLSISSKGVSAEFLPVDDERWDDIETATDSAPAH